MYYADNFNFIIKYVSLELDYEPDSIIKAKELFDDQHLKIIYFIH